MIFCQVQDRRCLPLPDVERALRLRWSPKLRLNHSLLNPQTRWEGPHLAPCSPAPIALSQGSRSVGVPEAVKAYEDADPPLWTDLGIP